MAVKSSETRLQWYLDKIEKQEPINYGAFLKVLPKDVLKRHREIFSCSRQGSDKWQVQVNEQGAFEDLKRRAQAPTSRQEAANQGDSHRQLTQATFMLVHHEGLQDERPDVVMIETGRVLQKFAPKPNALIIENEDNFAQWTKMLSFCRQVLGEELSLSNCDIVLGGGNRVLKEGVLAWLSQYSTVVCALDYDLGGLKIYRGLLRSLPGKTLWLEPLDWQPWAALFQKSPESSDRLLKAIDLARELDLTDLADTFHSTRRFMEQEVLLGHDD